MNTNLPPLVTELQVCDRDHSEHDDSHHFAHFTDGVMRVCTRIAMTDTWVYDPQWEVDLLSELSQRGEA